MKTKIEVTTFGDPYRKFVEIDSCDVASALNSSYDPSYNPVIYDPVSGLHFIEKPIEKVIEPSFVPFDRRQRKIDLPDE